MEYKCDGKFIMVSFSPTSFHYIKLRDYGDRGERKLPLEQWGGYDTDFEENDCVYSYAETRESDHPNWGIVGIREDDTQLVVIDLDCHKVDDFEPSELKRPHEDVTIIKSIHPDRDIPGFHFYLLLDIEERSVQGTKSWIDIKANQKGHVVSPFHNEQYQHVHGDDLVRFPNVTEINRHLEYKGELLLTSDEEYSVESGGPYEPLEEPPEEVPYCLLACLDAREKIPRDGTHFNPWKVDSAAGRRLVALGYSKKEAMTLLKKFEPKDGWDAKETSYQLDMLYQKQLTPESQRSLQEMSIFEDDDYCDCEVCSAYFEEEASGLLPNEIHTDLAEAGLDADTHATVQGTARSGKTHGITQRACEAWDGEKIVCLSPTHEEAKAWIDKWKQHDVHPAYLVGEEHAREVYGVKTSGPVNMEKEGVTPKQASEWENCNAYQSYVLNAVEGDVIVTVPELLNRIDDYDWIIATEEAAIKRLTASPMPVACIKRINQTLGRKAKVFGEDGIASAARTCQDVVSDIDDLGQSDSVHQAIRAGAQCIIDINDIAGDWDKKHWEEASDTWMDLVTDVERRLEEMKELDLPEFSRLYTRLQNYNRIDEEILNTLYYDGTLEYGNSDDNRKQMFYVGDPDRPFVPIEDDATMWLAGNSIPMMTKFHEMVHGDPPEPIGYKNDYEPLRKALDGNIVVKYTGRENQNQQSHDIQRTIEQIQQLSPTSPSSLLISGSSEYCAEHAKRIKLTTTPSGNDDLDSIRNTYLKANMCVVFPENSQWSEGVDMPEAQMGAIYNGHFAAPFEEYVKEKSGDPSLLKAERVRAAQNATLRPSNIPSRTDGVIGTGKTPLLVPSYHVPEEIFELFEEYGIHIYETSDVAEMRRLLITVLDLEAEEYEGKILSEDDLPPKIKKFRKLLADDGGGSD